MKRVILVLLLGVVAMPILYLGLLAMGRSWFFPEIIPSEVSVSILVERVRSEAGFVSALGTSMSLALGIALFSSFFGFIVSKEFALSTRKRWWLISVYLPYLISPVILAILMSRLFIFFGLSGAYFGVFWGHVLMAFPFSIIYFQSFWAGGIFDQMRTAANLGASSVQVYQDIVIPTAWPFVLACFFQCFLISWFEYGFTYVIGLGKVESLTILTYKYLIEANTNQAAAASLFLIAPPLMFLWLNKFVLFTEKNQ